MLASDVGSWRIVPDPEGHDPQRNCKLKNNIILATKTDKETKVVEVGETDGDIKATGIYRISSAQPFLSKRTE
jgi:hypothetical protein